MPKPENNTVPPMESLRTLMPSEETSSRYAGIHAARYATLGEPLFRHIPVQWGEPFFSTLITQEEWLANRTQQAEREGREAKNRNMNGRLMPVLSDHVESRKAIGDGESLYHVFSEFLARQWGSTLFRPLDETLYRDVAIGIAFHPDMNDFLFHAGEGALEEGQMALAVSIWERLPVKYNGTPEAWDRLADAAELAGDAKTAEACRERMKKTFPDLPEDWKLNWSLRGMKPASLPSHAPAGQPGSIVDVF